MTARYDVIFLHGGSSSGKTGIARCLQALLPRPWLRTGVDVLLDTIPARLQGAEDGIRFRPDGGIEVGAAFRQLRHAWRAGVVATVCAGAPMIIDEVFLRGCAEQLEWQQALAGLRTLWIGVQCAADVAEGRELARGDRVVGMARAQAVLVHAGVSYDLVVDTTHTEALECAQRIVNELNETTSQL
ncbi:chloramphenicol phosphotransferase CPT family protein [Mycobacterium haemophilum]|uniref:chloramphenicol phosphotransferase CPT family protein n=1 Tax=Mycobacterium haemophilum TaxID=29311 RepID=UPI000B0703F9|nr:hypothetical protein [Mycobacterium haemophilum]